MDQAKHRQTTIFDLATIGLVEQAARPIIDSSGGLNTFDIHNRRFLGSKHKLLHFIEKIIKDEAPQARIYCDLFAGTGVVGA